MLRSWNATTQGLIAALLLFAVSPLTAQAEGPRLNTPHPDLDLPAITRGQKAVEALGRDLPAAAEAHGMSAERLTELLLRERTLNLDRKGRLFYSDEILPSPQPADGTDQVSGAGAAAYPLADTFQLHSRPGAAKLIYLDFDGHVLSGTAWNANYNGGADIVCPPFDFEGGPGVFTDNELARIQSIWKRVAEDYAPFDVDVTTEYLGEAALTRSSSADQSYGMRVLISPISSYVGNYGGVAYVGVFNLVGDYYKPALVFPEKLGPYGEKYVAEASSHETGHTLGLSHDGTTTGTEYYAGHGSGTTGWAPIMGNSYGKNVTQWSKGEYASANNSQDDLAVIAGYTAYRLDDHGSGTGAATPLPPGPQLAAAGIVERNTDGDVFSFQAGTGPLAVNVSPASPDANLDVLAELLDSSGALLASSNPATALNAALSLSVTPGIYYLRIAGAGYATPSTGYSSYASLGQYSLAATVPDPAGYRPPVAVATASPSSGDAPLQVQFSSAGSYDPDGVIVQVLWSFGDGTSSTEANPLHTYSAGGTTYAATLTVRDNAGLESSQSVAVTVNSADAGLVSYWLFDEGSGTAANDSVGQSDAALFGPVWVPGRIHSALRFDGAGDYLQIGAADLPAPWTAALWVRREAATAGASLLSSAAGALRLEQRPNLYKVGLSKMGTGDWSFNYTAPVGAWAHLAFVNTGAEVRLYVNGAFNSSLAQTMPLPQSRAGLGLDGLDPLAGTLDEVRVYNRALNEAEVLAVYQDAPPPDATPPTVPQGLSAAAESCSRMALSWAGSADAESGVEGYNLYRDGVLLKHVLAPDTATTDGGLTESRTYSYAASAVDNAGNESARSQPVTAATPACPDMTAPTPNPMTWASRPAAASATSVTMTATAASDPSGVEYYFACMAGGGHDSGWQASRSYTDTGLTPGGSYTYQVQARDLSAGANATGSSAAASATTPVSAATLHVESIALSTAKSGKSYLGRATVYVYDNLAKPVSGATVTGAFSGSFSESRSATTDKNGKAVLTTVGKATNPTFTFCVTNVTHTTLVYDAGSNKAGCVSR